MPVAIVEQIRLLHEWSPLLGYGRRLGATLDARERAAVIGEMLKWLALKTRTTLDDRIAADIAAVLRTPEGVTLVRDLVSLGDALANTTLEKDS